VLTHNFDSPIEIEYHHNEFDRFTEFLKNIGTIWAQSQINVTLCAFMMIKVV